MSLTIFAQANLPAIIPEIIPPTPRHQSLRQDAAEPRSNSRFHENTHMPLDDPIDQKTLIAAYDALRKLQLADPTANLAGKPVELILKSLPSIASESDRERHHRGPQALPLKVAPFQHESRASGVAMPPLVAPHARRPQRHRRPVRLARPCRRIASLHHHHAQAHRGHRPRRGEKSERSPKPASPASKSSPSAAKPPPMTPPSPAISTVRAPRSPAPSPKPPPT